MRFKLTPTEKAFNKSFFTDSGVLDSTMNHIQGKMQAEASIEDSDELDEAFFKNAMLNVLRRKTNKINSSFTVTSNKTYSKFDSELAKLCNVTLRIQPDFIIKHTNGLPLSVIELKSIFGAGTTKSLVLRDIARLAMYHKLFPKCKCVFVIAGKKTEMISFFNTAKFKFKNNLTGKVRPPYSWISLETDDLELTKKDYVKAMKSLGINEIQIKLSRTQYGQKYHSMSYVVRVPDYGYRASSNFTRTSWDKVVSGDFVYIGNEPSNSIAKYNVVDKLELKLQRVMFQTNDVDDQVWSEFELDDLVWVYTPKGKKY